MQTGRKGQALIELSVFGAIFLMVMGAMLSYGLRYNFMQQANQLAYRRALKIASDPNQGAGSYTLITDKHIPDPVDPFGIGSVTPVMASASVMRRASMDSQPQINDSKSDLATTVVDIQESQINGNAEPLHRFVYAGAGFRYESPLDGGAYSDAQIKKYQLIYGEVMAKDNNKTIRITDTCSGEVFDFNSCYEQAMRLVDEKACRRYCADVSDATTDCVGTCAAQLNPPNQVDANFYPAGPNGGGGPWYAANYVKHGSDDTHGAVWYSFPVLDDLFRNLGSRGLGFQPAVNSEQTRDTSLRRIETPGTAGSVTTEEHVAWLQTNNKSFGYNNNLDPGSGDEIPHQTPQEYTDNVTSDVYVSKVGGNYTETWTTGK